MSWRDEFLTGAAPAAVETDACVIAGCVSPIADGDLVYCAEHRAKADDGTLLLRCVFCGQTVAPHDPIACQAHRAEMDTH